MSSPALVTNVRYVVTAARGDLDGVEPELLERVRGELAERIDRELEAMTLAAFLERPAPPPWRYRPSPLAAAPADFRGIVRSSMSS